MSRRLLSKIESTTVWLSPRALKLHQKLHRLTARRPEPSIPPRNPRALNQRRHARAGVENAREQAPAGPSNTMPKPSKQRTTNRQQVCIKFTLGHPAASSFSTPAVS
jgi:hypothetical protein